MNRSTPPNSDEFEISIIGPGRGECVLVHLGDNEWCIVDSCTAPGRQEPVALEYLSGFGDGALLGVRLVVATHWHDDHIRGLASILRRVPNASFACSAALDTDIFAKLVAIADMSIPGRSGVDEFAAIMNLLEEKTGRGTPQNLVAPAFAIENRRLLHLPAASRRFPAAITALSPSDSTLRIAFNEIAGLLPSIGEAQRRIPDRSPNHSSVVLWIELGSRRALLGADLEHTGRPGEGWMAILGSRQHTELAAVFKVPHHGSVGADCLEVWSKMLIKDPVAVVTPFAGGMIRLPQPSDLNRLAKRTASLFCTAESPGKPPKRDRIVEKMLRKRGTPERRVIEGDPGHVRVRWSVSNEGAAPVVELFNGAFHVPALTSRN